MLLPHRIHKLLLNTTILMTPKYYKSVHFYTPKLPLNPSPLFFFFKNPKLSSLSLKPLSISTPFSQIFSCFSSSSIPPSTAAPKVGVELQENKRMELLIQKLKEIEIDVASYKPGQSSRLLCPKCKGGDSREKSFSLCIADDGNSAFWTCFRGKCGWKGNTRVVADTKSTYQRMNKVTTVKQLRKITEEDLELEPLCNELITYFTDRLISKETLRRNYVMQRVISGDQGVIAFTYRRNGSLVTCKYQEVDERFWQEENTEKIFYGLDDINGASDIIIVESELDKLSMEEAGFRNCVSVPSRPSASGASKDLPSEKELGHRLSVSLELQRIPAKGISDNIGD